VSNINIEITRLHNEDFLKIINGSITYYGGDQAWFHRYSQQFGGCGPTAAANILAYMATTNAELSKLYDYDMKNIYRADFVSFMEDVYKYVTPMEVPVFNKQSDKINSQVGIPTLGLINLNKFARSVEKYAKGKGVNLEANWCEANTREDARNYISKGLKKDRPVAMINMFRPVDMLWTDPETNITSTTTYKQHWVTVTGIIDNKTTGEETLEVSSWGGRALIDFKKLFNNIKWYEKFFQAGFVYFEHKI